MFFMPAFPSDQLAAQGDRVLGRAIPDVKGLAWTALKVSIARDCSVRGAYGGGARRRHGSVAD